MPANFPEVWLRRVTNNLTTADAAPWLDGVSEIDAPVMEVGAGTETESNYIHVPLSEFEPDVFINNTTYPLAVQQYTDTEVILKLDKYQTAVTDLSDDQVMGAAYDRIDNATKSHTRAVTKKKYAKAIHAIAPAANTANTPVTQTTGDVVGTRKRFTYEDLVAMKDRFDKLEIPEEGRRIVLCTDHYNDALLDRKNFGDQLTNYQKGKLAPVIAGFEIYQYVSNPYFSGTNKVPFASVPGAGTFQASVAFYVPNLTKKTGNTKQYFRKSDIDPENQTNRYGIRHYFMALPKMNKYIGAIASAPSA